MAEHVIHMLGFTRAVVTKLEWLIASVPNEEY